MHCLKSYGSLSILLLCRKGTHIMEAVAKLDEYNSNVLVHRKKHFSYILNMRLFLVLDLHLHNFGKTVNKHSDSATKHLVKNIKVCLVRAVLHCIMKEGRTYRVCIKAKLGNNRCHLYRMRHISLATKTKLSLMHLVGIQKSLLNLLNIITTVTLVKDLL